MVLFENIFEPTEMEEITFFWPVFNIFRDSLLILMTHRIVVIHIDIFPGNSEFTPSTFLSTAQNYQEVHFKSDIGHHWAPSGDLVPWVSSRTCSGKMFYQRVTKPSLIHCSRLRNSTIISRESRLFIPSGFHGLPMRVMNVTHWYSHFFAINHELSC